ncbi:hypothetical protein CBR_g888 [Chara braunii]|uniref:Uncharacterized protein n=1 Tax=Chara braunii TaxID=69332 RepID=A0A388KCT8_CHABU|nr:hypothetical protein CBR_g888 [Chara braunii]|eukprot:GBG67763.1 hypothetical protein CBR_g888 [Chara braunii]
MGPWRLSPGFLASKGRGSRGHAKAPPLPPPRSTGAASFSLESVPRIACSQRDGNGRNQAVSWSNFEDVVNEILPFRLVERQETEWSQRMGGGRGAMFLKGDCRPFIKLFTLTAIAFSTIFIFYETRFLRGTARAVDVGVGRNRAAEGTLLPEFSIVGMQSRLLSSLREGEEGRGLEDNPHLVGEGRENGSRMRRSAKMDDKEIEVRESSS